MDYAALAKQHSGTSTRPVDYAALAAQFGAVDPTESMSGMELFRAGTGKAFADIGRGVGQAARGVLSENMANRMGLPTQADID
jgi:hypothetical protein